MFERWKGLGIVITVCSVRLRPDGHPRQTAGQTPTRTIHFVLRGVLVPLLRSSAESLLAQLLNDHAVPRLTRQFVIDVGYMPSSSEVRSWQSSLPVLLADLNEAGLAGVEVLVEHRLPLSSKRTDVIVAGNDARTGAPTYLVVELKQWSRAQADPDDVELVTVDAYGSRPVLHPGKQVQNYVQYMRDFVRVLESDPNAVSGAAYLHNASENSVASLRLRPETPASRLFTGEQRGIWLEYLAERFAPEPGASAADVLLASAVAPSKQLMKLAAQEIKDREQFVLLDEQEVAYRLVLNAVRQAIREDHKSVVVVTGGPGSGKSVIALSLLGEFYRQGRTAEHATGSKAFTETLRRVAGNRDSRVKQLFGYFNQFAVDEPNSLDVLILDEAHRIRESSNNRFTKRTQRSTKPQIEELIDVARVPVFLLDEHQVVRPGRSGRSRRSGRRRSSEVFRSTRSNLTHSSARADRGCTRNGSCVCSDSPTVDQSNGPGTTTTHCSWRTLPRRWKLCWPSGGSGDMTPGCLRGSVGHGRTRCLVSRWRPMCGSGIGPGRGTTRRNVATMAPRRGHCGRPRTGLRPGRVRIHRARIRVRLVRSDPRPGPCVARRPLHRRRDRIP